MSTLITASLLLTMTDRTGRIYFLTASPIDQAKAQADLLVSDLQTGFAGDPAHGYALFPFASGIATPSGSAGGGGAFGGASGVGRGSLGAGQGALNRRGFFTGLFKWLEALRTDIKTYGGAAPVGAVDLSTFASYQNGLTPFSCLFSPDFAALYWYVYGQSPQLAAAAVFAPVGVKCASVAITGANASSLTGYNIFVNAYTTPAPTIDDYGNSVYQGAMPMAQGFAPFASSRCHVTTNFNGTCAVTVRALNQAGVAANWTATLDNAAAGTNVTLTPATNGDRIASVPSAVTVAGAATAGAFDVQCASLERAYQS